MFSRAIVIVLDSVGIGELPDAALYEDQGSNTLGNIAAAVPLNIPTLAAHGHVAARRAARHAAGAVADRGVRPHGGAIVGQGLGDRALGADGRRARSRVPDVSRTAFRTDLIAAVRSAHRPPVDRQRRRVRHRDHRRARPRAHGDRLPDRLHVGRQRVSDRRARRHRARAAAVRMVRGRLRPVRQGPGPRPRHRAAVHRPARIVPAHAESPRLRDAADRARRCSIGWSRTGTR